MREQSLGQPVNEPAYEVNFDSLVGPTHFYGGLSLGNMASMTHGGEVSNPKMAAMQGLEKMRFLHRLGIKQAVLPPHERPHLPTLRKLGFNGTPATIFRKVKEQAPWLLELISSSANMWAANAATSTPSIDSNDKHCHFTPANLLSNFHRSIETEETKKILHAIFKNPVFFKIHDPLPSAKLFADEGAANHTRFSRSYNSPGIHLFAYSQSLAFDQVDPSLTFPGRQTLEASEAITRLHELNLENVVFAKQNPDAINAGVFHNDVISVGNLNVFLYHEFAFNRQNEILSELKSKFENVCDMELICIEVKNNEIPLGDVISSYLFNSQIVSLADSSMALIAPAECQHIESVAQFLKKLTDNNDSPIYQVHYLDLNQSMRNGGGPACLRMRVVLNSTEINEINPQIFFSEGLYEKLSEWINNHYPNKLTNEDLFNPAIYEKNCIALNELTNILNLGKIYSFQRE